jgi:hypothetical protein
MRLEYPAASHKNADSRTFSNPTGQTPEGRNPIGFLLQSDAALFADTLVDIIPNMFFTRRAPPVKGGKINKGKDEENLRQGKGALRVRTKKIGAFIENGNQENENGCRCDGDDLAGPAYGEILLDLLRVSFVHQCNSFRMKKEPHGAAREVQKKPFDYHAKTGTSQDEFAA